MRPLFLVATIAGKRVALPVDRVDSVVDIDAITPVPRAAPPVAGLAALRSRVITVIDPATVLGTSGRGETAMPGRAIILADGGHFYGVLVDSVEDVADVGEEVRAVCGPLDDGWARVAIGMVDDGGGGALVIDPLRWRTF